MDNKFYKIGEVSKILGLRTSTLRYWETEFKQLRPVKSGGGQRFYTKKHIDLLTDLKRMLYLEKYTIDGAKKKLKEASREEGCNESAQREAEALNALISAEELKKELNDILSILK